MLTHRRSFVVIGASLLAASPAVADVPLSPTALASGAQLSTTYGIEFVTIGSPGNAPYPGNPDPGVVSEATGRGGVSYAYRIGRYEVTTSQWAQFYNAYTYVSSTQGSIPFVQMPSFWGAVSSFTNPYGPGPGWRVPAGNEMRPVGGISWRTAAIFCNWLCNGQAVTRDAFMNGAYDVSTFGYGGNGEQFTDQSTHNPGAAFWIPTWDEWLKAAHYDPNRSGPGQSGYWNYSNTSDAPITYGPPGAGQANALWMDAASSQFRVPLGSYPQVQSPWGLLDVAGETSEWTESVLTALDGRRYRYLDGTAWSDGPFMRDTVWSSAGQEFPTFPDFAFGLRVASAVPAPSTWVGIAALSWTIAGRRRTPVSPSPRSAARAPRRA